MFEEFKQLLVEKLEIEPDLVKPEAQLANDLGINSLELADLVLFCEDKYGIEKEQIVRPFYPGGGTIKVRNTKQIA